MVKQGWSHGSGLGKTQKGTVNPAALDMLETAQNPRSKTGLGYTGEKLQRFNVEKQKKKCFITTSYDSQDQEADGILRRSKLTYNKRR